MSANASLQHIASDLGLGGRIITQDAPAAPLRNYGLVGWIASVTTLWLTGRLRRADRQRTVAAEPLSLAAAAETTCDVGEPMIGA